MKRSARLPHVTTPAARRVTLSLSLVAVLPLAACGGGGSSEPEHTGEGGTLRAALHEPVECVDPQQGQFVFAQRPGRQIVDTLTFANDKGEVSPWLATDWTIEDNATRYVFTLRDDVTFSDGTPFDAQNVVDNFTWLTTNETGFGGGTAFQNYVGSTALDSKTVEVTFSEPRSDFLMSTSSSIVGLVSKSTTEKTPEQRCVEGVVGTGPFVQDPDEYDFDQAARLVKRDDYNWGPAALNHEGPASLDAIEYRVIPDPAVRADALRSGEVDYIYETPNVDFEALQAEGFNWTKDNSIAMPTGIVVNASRGFLTEPAVREALQLGIDREAIIAETFEGVPNPGSDIVGPGSPLWNDHADILAYNKERAQQLLESAGWTADGDNRVRSRNGQPLQISFTFSDNTDNRVIAEAIQQQLIQVGIDIVQNPQTASGHSELRAAGDYELIRDSGELWPPAFFGPPRNASKISGADAEELAPLFEQLTAEGDPTKQREINRQIADVILGGGYFVPLVDRPSPIETSISNLQNVVVGADISRYFLPARLES